MHDVGLCSMEKVVELYGNRVIKWSDLRALVEWINQGIETDCIDPFENLNKKFAEIDMHQNNCEYLYSQITRLHDSAMMLNAELSTEDFYKKAETLPKPGEMFGHYLMEANVLISPGDGTPLMHIIVGMYVIPTEEELNLYPDRGAVRIISSFYGTNSMSTCVIEYNPKLKVEEFYDENMDEEQAIALCSKPGDWIPIIDFNSHGLSVLVQSSVHSQIYEQLYRFAVSFHNNEMMMRLDKDRKGATIQ